MVLTTLSFWFLFGFGTYAVIGTDTPTQVPTISLAPTPIPTQIPTIPPAYNPYISYSQQFREFREKWSRTYDGDVSVRFGVFVDALNEIYVHNANVTATYKKGINQFSDMTVEEKKRYIGDEINFQPAFSGCEQIVRSQDEWNEPDEFVWPTNPARDQGMIMYPSSHIFSSIGAIGASLNIRTNLSIQQVIDCVPSQSDLESTYLYARQGLCLEKDMPYVGFPEPNNCSHLNCIPHGYVDGCVVIPTDEKMIMWALQTSPLSVVLDGEILLDYESGIIDRIGSAKNHGVLLIGYGKEHGLNYWIIQNSWGNWGENGYARIVRHEGIIDYVLGPL